MGIHDAFGDDAEKLIEYVDEGRTDLSAAPLEVPSRCYTDPAYFERELEDIFYRLPLMAALSVELPEPGDYKAMDLVGKPILLTRKKDGQVAAMLNVCSHRGLILAPEGYGNARQFSCAYHGWTFVNDGRLQGVTDAGKFGDLCKDERGLTLLPCVEAGGFIWVILTPGLDIDIAAHLGGMLAELQDLGFEKWHFFGSRTIHGANWKIAYDGYLEGYHFAAAHPETINTRTFCNIMHFTAMGPHLRIAFAQREIKKVLGGLPREVWGDNECNGFDFVRTIFPNVSIFVAPELTQIAQLIPGPTADKNTTNLYYIRRDPPKDEQDAAAMEDMIDWICGVVDKEDYVMGLNVQKGLKSGAFESVVFGRNERGNQYFHKYVDYYVSKDPNKKPPDL